MFFCHILAHYNDFTLSTSKITHYFKYTNKFQKKISQKPPKPIKNEP